MTVRSAASQRSALPRRSAGPALIAGTTLLAGVGLAWLARGAGDQRPAGPLADAHGSPNTTPSAAVAAPVLERRAAAPVSPSAANEEEPRAGDARREAPSPPAPAELARARRLLAASDLRGRYEGIRLLAALRPAEAVPEILAFLEDSRTEERVLLQRLAAVSLLGELDGISTGAELRTLYEQGDAGVRRAAARALERQGDSALVQRELSALAPELAQADGALRARAAEQAGALASPLAIPVLVPLLADSNSEVRAQAIDGLWRCGDSSLVPELERLLDDPVERVRERARRALRALRGEDPDHGP